MTKESIETKYQSKVFARAKEETFGKSSEERRKKIFYGILSSTIVLLVKYFVFGKTSAVNYVLELIISFGVVGIIYYFVVFIANFLFIAPRLIGLEQEKELEKLNPQKANIDIKEYHSPSYGQATKVGISIKNNGYDLLPNIKVVGDILRKRTFFTDRDNDVINKNFGEIFIEIEKDTIEFKNSINVSFVEIQGENIVLLSKSKLHLATLKEVSEYDSMKWDFQFEIFGKIKDEKFDNGLYQVCVDTRKTQHEIYLNISEPLKVE